MQKYHRGGYFLIPFYLLLMGLAATLALASVRHRCKSAGFRALARLTLACSLASILAQVFLVYRTIREEASQRSASERTTRIEPRAWFRDHVLPGARIGIVDGSELYGPPVWDLGHTTVPTLLPQYWLFPDKLQTQVPPTIAEVEAQTDILVFSNFSLWALDKALRNFAPENLRRNWQPFFGELRDRYPLVVFESAHENYTVSAVKIYVVNSSILRDVDTALRSVPDRGMTFMPPRNGAMPAAATQRPFAWLGEYDDSTLPCIHHDGLGRLMLAKDAKDADLWFYAEGLNGWFWTRKTIYPCLLRQDDGVWLRYEGQTERGPILRELQQPDGDVDR